jgi:hypothetical protein
MKTTEKGQPMCRRLRSKGMYIDVEPEPWLPSGHDGFYWCSKTQTALGPDGNPVKLEDCCSSRDCFEKG